VREEITKGLRDLYHASGEAASREDNERAFSVKAFRPLGNLWEGKDLGSS
jgi:hypothetical protein